MKYDWTRITSDRSTWPPEDQEVNTKIDDKDGYRNETTLTFHNGLWWFPDKSMYVYYTPTHWHPL